MSSQCALDADLIPCCFLVAGATRSMTTECHALGKELLQELLPVFVFNKAVGKRGGKGDTAGEGTGGCKADDSDESSLFSIDSAALWTIDRVGV